MRPKLDVKRTAAKIVGAVNDLSGLRLAVEELREFRRLRDKEALPEYTSAIRFSEMSVVQMAESLVDRTFKK